MKQIVNLIFEPKGKYDPALTYNIKDTVTNEDGSRVYFALQDVPAGTPLDNEEYWKLQIDMAATKEAMDAATARAEAAAERAENAAGLGGGGGGTGGGSGLPGVSGADNGKLLIVQGGQWIIESPADVVEPDNTKPITSAAVYATVGNIEELLKTI